MFYYSIYVFYGIIITVFYSRKIAPKLANVFLLYISYD